MGASLLALAKSVYYGYYLTLVKRRNYHKTSKKKPYKYKLP